MSKPAAANPSALSPAETERLAQLVSDVLAAEWPRLHLQQELDTLEREQKPALAAALFESLMYRIDLRDYWLYFRVWRAYRALGPTRDDAAYFAAAMAVQLEPAWSGSSQVFSDMFHILRRRGHDGSAAGLFHHQMEYQPEQPAAEPAEILPLLARLGGAAANPIRPPYGPDSRIDHKVIAAETRPAWTFPAIGGTPYCLHPLAAVERRPAVEVSELAGGQLLISRDAVIAIDRTGALHADLSVCGFPEQVRRKLERQEQAGAAIEQREVDEAVVISDRFPPPNLCHQLFDQLTRLHLYRRVGVDPARVLVVGPELRAGFQRQILRRAGVEDCLGTDRVLRLRAGRLWISSNCRDLRHAGHLGAAWALDYVRETLGGQGTKGWRRLYVSRADVATRQVVNEAEVIALLEPHGFEVIVPGRMSYEAQLAAFRQASHVIGTHGAGLAHLVLCPPGAEVLEIFHPLYGNNAYAMQAAAAGVNYTAMVGRDWQSDRPEWNDPTLADVATSQYLERNLRVDPGALGGYLASVV